MGVGALGCFCVCFVSSSPLPVNQTVPYRALWSKSLFCVPRASWYAEHLESYVLWVCTQLTALAQRESLQLKIHRTVNGK